MRFRKLTFCAVSHIIVLMSHMFPVTCRSIDELIAGASETSSFYLADMDAGTVRHELDMILTIEQYNSLYEPSKALSAGKARRSKRKAIRGNNYRWPKKEIPYKIVSNIFNSADMKEIEAAIDEWQGYTCIKFRRATSSENNYVSIDNGNGCYSYVGMIGGPQTLGLAGGCRVKGVIVHEMGHAIGFQHEQNRPDRDNYVTIVEKNIPPSLLYNFKKYPVDAVDNYGVPYDYRSIMQYGGRAFSFNGELTIKTKDPQFQNVIGNREGLSFYDIKLANLMYSCNEGCPRTLCPEPGFLGKDCKCWCPGSPVRLCDSSGAVQTTPKVETPVTSPSAPCSDMNKYCQPWAEAGYCRTNTYVKTYCRASCRSCEPGTNPENTVCKDVHHNCADFKRRGLCIGFYNNYMRTNCQSTCEYCGSLINEDIRIKDENAANVLTSTFVLVVASLFLTWL